MQNVLSILFCLTLFYLVVALRLKAYVSVLRMQGILLTAIIVFPFINNLSIHVVIIPVLFFAIKVILIPKYINRVIDNIDIDRIIKPTIQQINFLLLVICSVILIFVASSLLPKNTDLDIITIASGFSAILTGIYVIIFRKTLIVHVVGFLVLENGIFLFGTSVAAEFPMIIEIGTLLDVFVVVFLMGIALNKISSTISGSDVSVLRRLKD